MLDLFRVATNLKFVKTVKLYVNTFTVKDFGTVYLSRIQ